MNRARWLSPAGAAALAVFAVPREALPPSWSLQDRAGRPRAWPAEGEVVVRRLSDSGRPLDELIVVGRTADVELHAHGSVAIGRLLSERLGCEAARTLPAESLRAARALTSALHGPLRGLLDTLERGEPISLERQLELERAVALLDFGERLRSPPRVALVGRPNAGKSTLFNRWVGQERALVSPRPGTTRDAVVARVSLAGVPIELEDTAGGESAPAELGEPELVVHLQSEPGELPPAGGRSVLAVLGRSDERASDASASISGLTGAGLKELQARVLAVLGLDRPPEDDLWAPILPDHREQVRRASAGQQRG